MIYYIAVSNCNKERKQEVFCTVTFDQQTGNVLLETEETIRASEAFRVISTTLTNVKVKFQNGITKFAVQTRNSERGTEVVVEKLHGLRDGSYFRSESEPIVIPLWNRSRRFETNLSIAKVMVNYLSKYHLDDSDILIRPVQLISLEELGEGVEVYSEEDLND